MSAGATARIVVQVTPTEKRSISAKAKSLGIPVSKLMRSSANAFSPEDDQAELAVLADAAHAAAERSCKAIDDSLAFIAASEKRIAKMEGHR
jgi:hypothetical protein